MHSMAPDICICTETELPEGDVPVIPGYSTMIPTVSATSKIRMVLFTKKSLHAEQLPTGCVDVQIVAVKVGNEGIVGIYRQFTHISSSGTQSGSLLEEEEFNSIETVIRSMSEKFQTLHTGGI